MVNGLYFYSDFVCVLRVSVCRPCRASTAQIGRIWLRAVSHSVTAVSAGKDPSCWFLGKPQSTLRGTRSSSPENPGFYGKHGKHKDKPDESWRLFEKSFPSFEYSLITPYFCDPYSCPLKEDVGLSARTFIILSLHFLPEESTSTFTVLKRRQNSWRDTITRIESKGTQE